MPLDQSYLDAIKGFEGYTPQASWDYQQYSSGYGTKAQPGDNNIPPDQLKAIHEQRFKDEIGKAEQSVDNFNPKLPAGTRAALVDLTYNAGPGWQQQGLGKAVNAGDWDSAKSLYQQYNKAGGQVLPGLVNRRAVGASWFGDGVPATATQVATAQNNAPASPLTLPGAPVAFPAQAPQAQPQAQPQQADASGAGQVPAYQAPAAPQIQYYAKRPISLAALKLQAPFFRG